MTTVKIGALREEFVRLLTTDSETKDARRRGFNQAIFLPGDDPTLPGHAVWDRTDLDMVLAKFDRAARNLAREGKRKAVA